MNNAGWIVVLGFYTLVMIGGIYYYEDKFNRLDKDYKDLEQEFFQVYTELVDANNGCEIPTDLIEKNAKLEEDLDLYKAMCESNHNAINQQMDINEGLNENNDHLRDIIKQLDTDNLSLKLHNNALKKQVAEIKATAGDWQRAYELSKPIQYESSGWAGMPEISNTTYTIDTNPYKVDINYIQDHIDFEQ